MKENLLIVHGGGPTPVINASLAGVINEAKKHSEIQNIYGAVGGIKGFLEERIIDLGHQPQEKLDQLPFTPGSAIGTCRYKLREDDYPKLLQMLKKYDIGYFLCTGGNDTMDTCNKVHKMEKDFELRVMGIPKTIDNDLALTDHSPGFGSAAKYVAISVDEVGRDVEALNIHVCIIETMGRNAGWLAASSLLARKREGDAPHLIYLPERGFSEEEFLDDVDNLFSKRGGIVVVVSEGLKDENGIPLVSPKHKSDIDGFGHALPGNVSHYLADLVSEKLGIRARSEKPGLLGRVSMALQSEVDREEAIKVGKFAVRAAVEGKSGFMVGLKRISNSPYKCELELFPLDEVANVEKKVPKIYINERGNDVKEDFIAYCRPLVGFLPEYIRLEERWVKF